MVKNHGFLLDFLLLWWTVGDGGGKVTPTPELLSPRSQISGPPSTILPSCSDEVRFSKNSGLHLPLARCTSHHALPSMYVLSYGIIPVGAYPHYEGQFVDMKRPFCWVYADGVDIFLPVVLLSRQQGVTSVCQVRGESKPVERSHAAAQPRQSRGPRRGKSIQRAVSI